MEASKETDSYPTLFYIKFPGALISLDEGSFVERNKYQVYKSKQFQISSCQELYTYDDDVMIS